MVPSILTPTLAALHVFLSDRHTKEPLPFPLLQLDLLNVMSYDAGSLDAPAGNPTGYDPRVAYDAYRSLFSGKIAMGLEIAPEVSWQGLHMHGKYPLDRPLRSSSVAALGCGGSMHGMHTARSWVVRPVCPARGAPCPMRYCQGVKHGTTSDW